MTDPLAADRVVDAVKKTEQKARAHSEWHVSALIGAALILLALVVTLLVQLLSSDVHVSAQDLQVAVQLLHQQADKEPGLDRVILVHPPWREDLQQALHKAMPKQRVVLAPPVKQGWPAGPLVIVRAGSTPGPLGLSDYPVERSAQAGALDLQWFRSQNKTKKIGEKSIIFSHIKQIKAFFDAPAQRYLCDKYDAARQTYHCPGLPEWNHIGPQDMRINGQNQRMLWAHPHTGYKLNIELPLPAKPQVFDFVYGLADSAVAVPGGADIQLQLAVGNRILGEYVQENKMGLNHQRIKIPDDASGGMLRIIISCAKDGARHFGIDVRRMTNASAQELSP